MKKFKRGLALVVPRHGVLLKATPFLFGRGCFEEKTGWIWSLALEGVALWLMFFNGRIQRMVGWRRSALSPCLFGKSPSPLSPF